MTFYALRNMYVDSVYVSPLVEQQMMILMQCLDPHSEYLTPAQARANEDMLLGPTAMGPDTQHPSPNTPTTSIKAEMVAKGIGYIAVGVFVQSTIDEFLGKLDSLKQRGMKSLIIDIRNNPGGFFDSALGMADELLPIGSLMVTTEGKHQPHNEVKAQLKGHWEKGKTVVLINEQTMSAAEIFAGALQDQDRAVLVGSRTFGKGLVQETLPFSDGSAIRLSVARYLTPSGRSIQKPYAGRPREAYWNEVSQRSATGALPAEAKTKVFHTLQHGRTIYGGGGIAPDVFVPAGGDALQQAISILSNDRRYQQLLTTSTTATWTSFSLTTTSQPSTLNSQPSTLHLSGTLPDRSYDGRTVVLEHHDPIYYDRATVIDSTRIADGKFTITATVADTLLMKTAQVRLTTMAPTDLPSTMEMPLILAPGSVKMTVDSMGITLAGEPQNEQFSRRVLAAERSRRQQQFALNNRYNALQAQRPLTDDESAEQRQQLETISREFMAVYGRYLVDNISQPYASELLFRYPLDRYTATDSALLAAKCDQQMLSRMHQREEARQQRAREFQQSQQLTNIGHRYREISAQQPDGTPVKLTAIVKPGHVTLLDFWASWCVPCRQEIPFLKELYAKYHDQGFDIISISLDKSKDAWLKAVDKEAMPWPQISDLKAWNGPVTQDYGIQAIPFVFLLDGQGRIVLKNLHGELLENAIRQQLSKR